MGALPPSPPLGSRGAPGAHAEPRGTRRARPAVLVGKTAAAQYYVPPLVTVVLRSSRPYSLAAVVAGGAGPSGVGFLRNRG